MRSSARFSLAFLPLYPILQRGAPLRNEPEFTLEEAEPSPQGQGETQSIDNSRVPLMTRRFDGEKTLRGVS